MTIAMKLFKPITQAVKKVIPTCTTGISTSKTYEIGAKLVKTATEPIGDTFVSSAQKAVKSSKSVSEFKPLLLFKLNKNTIRNLEQIKDPKELANACAEIICKRYKIPQKFMPEIFILENQNIPAAYHTNVHQIILDSKVTKSPFATFANLAHELEHTRQNLQILRTQRHGDKLINTINRMHAEIASNINIINPVLEKSDNEILALIKNGTIKDDAADWCKNFIIARQKGKKQLAKYINSTYEDISKYRLPAYQRMREDLIKELGVIPENSPLGKETKMIIESFKDSDFYDKNRKRYWTAPTEIMAYVREFTALYEYIIRKFI